MQMTYCNAMYIKLTYQIIFIINDYFINWRVLKRTNHLFFCLLTFLIGICVVCIEKLFFCNIKMMDY